MTVTKNAAAEFYKKHHFGIWFWFIVFVICAMVFRGLMQLPQIAANEETIQSLYEDIEYEQQRAEEIEELKGKVSTDEYIEKMAREKLGYIKEDEKVFIDVSKQDSED